MNENLEGEITRFDGFVNATLQKLKESRVTSNDTYSILGKECKYLIPNAYGHVMYTNTITPFFGKGVITELGETSCFIKSSSHTFGPSKELWIPYSKILELDNEHVYIAMTDDGDIEITKELKDEH